MPRASFILPLAFCLAAPSVGCGLFRNRRNSGNTSVATSVSVAQTGRDTATFARDEYEMLDSTSGEAKATRWFFLTVPLGAQTSADEVEENAYYQAVGKVTGCDALMMAHPKHRRVVVPLLIVNIVRYEAEVRGRCISLKDDPQLAGAAPSTRESSVVKPAAPAAPTAPVAPASPVASPAAPAQ